MAIVGHGNPYLMRSYTTPNPAAASVRGGSAAGHYGGGAKKNSSAAALTNPTMNGQHVQHNPQQPGYPHPNHPQLAHAASNYSVQSLPSSRSSDTTQGSVHSTFSPPHPSMPGNAGAVAPNGDVTATDNIMNSVADASSSLFQICVSLRQRLFAVPEFRQSLEEEEEDADDDTDPVTLLWRTFRRGYPLMDLYNALLPAKPLSLGAGVRDDKKGKAATFKFLQACVNELKFAAEDCFIITDLYGDDTTGFVKVARVVNRVLDILVHRGLVEDIRPTASDFEQAEKGIKRTQRQHIVSELVTTERTYVQHLELLQSFKHLVEEKGVIPGDAVHDIFLNLNSLLDFQRRFLIRVEQTNAQPETDQNWGKLFVLYCEAFKVYEPYIANQRKCEKTVVAEFSKLKDAGGSSDMRQMVESSTSLYGFLMKPFQRLSKYPLLLDDLYKKGDLDDERRADLLVGKEAATSVLTRTNKAVDREEKVEAVQELKMRVEDWKGHRVEVFGELLLYGTFTVLKSDNLASGKDGERQYHVYLFETILLCCKDIDLSKPKNKYSAKQLVDKRGKPKLQLKGRIFMQNVTDLVSLAKPGMDDIHIRIRSCQRIFWKGDPSIENFIIRFASEDAMKKWAQQIEIQRRRYRERNARNSDGSRTGGTSVTEFTYMQNQPALENPYADQADEEDDDDADGTTLVGSNTSGWAATAYPKSDFAQSRNGSSSSLRSRSTTGDSGGPTPGSAASSRAPHPRFPSGSMGQQQAPLALRTRDLHSGGMTASPGERAAADSYFSPVETPSMPMNGDPRTSSGSATYPFPRQGVPPHNGFYDEHPQAHNTRYTAPATGRPAMSQREQTMPPSNGYAPPGRRPGGPGGLHSAQSAGAPRNRSASSPDIHAGQPPHMRKGPGGPPGPPPAVPDVPAAYMQNLPHMVSRSQSNSPNLVNGLRERERGGGTQSPQLSSQQQRDRRGPPPPHQDVSPISYDRPDTRQGHYPLTNTNTNTSQRTITPNPALQQPTIPDLTPAPTQLKVKVHCPSASQTLTLVVPLNISCQSLKDRIDAKLQRSTNLSLGDRGPKEGQVKLKYLDEDDYVSIQSDEDVWTAFETWREQRGGSWGDGAVAGAGAAMGEIELFCQR